LYLKKIGIDSNLAFEKCWQTDKAERDLTGGAAGKLADFCSCCFGRCLCCGSSAYLRSTISGWRLRQPD